MPETINSLHAVLTLIAAGILLGLGWQLIALAFTSPKQAGIIAAALCVCLVVLAWVVPA